MTNDNASFSASDVKRLREITSAGMLECKNALVASAGDIEAAVEWLRKKGLAAADKKASRAAGEGLAAVNVQGKAGVVLELNSETDFVARNEKFQQLAKFLGEKLMGFEGGVEDFLASEVDGGTIKGLISNHIAVIGENINLSRFEVLRVENGVIGSYIHNKVTDGAGKIAVLVAISSSGDEESLSQLAKQLAMHIAAARPEVLSIENVDPTKVERERAIYTEQALGNGTPSNVVQKIVDGKIKKYYEDVVLLEQPFVMDNKKSVKTVIEEYAKQIGHDIKVQKYLRYSVGETLNSN
ncbi:elongation factor Ts [Rickettsiales endosymbiont of Peranema trichophorum]|uniref:translation elongation factor Ts n=1 Tax=Rickettsiales endosymbiont of Peranema trichophorum TaxID=2486577 RepID=UPI0010237DBA|nr:translation elongation factor Ts [Rickettsiales endosymbiont of Peranema trichophorum]RZI47771.1 elongation factor Ts [Rickettsiales endosymbiont of Peranema trichophorum]